jgi:hypothetical protein
MFWPRRNNDKVIKVWSTGRFCLSLSFLWLNGNGHLCHVFVYFVKYMKDTPGEAALPLLG